MELKGTYRENESPLERLRNKLTPFFTAVSIVAMEDTLKESPFKDNVQRSATTAHGYQKDIMTYLADIEILLGRLEALEYLDEMNDEEEEDEEEEEGGWSVGMKPESPGPDHNGN